MTSHSTQDFKILDKIQSPEQIRNLSFSELECLTQDLRTFIIRTISTTGGHLGSSLGTVELTIALLHVFDVPKDRILWDVGHQAYGYKILTDRKEKFHTIRQQGGIAGFPDPNESPYDHVLGGHASNTISSGFGMVVADHLLHQYDRYVISVVGDGALSGGVALEGLNNAGDFKLPYLIILNDNDMSISQPTGGVSAHLSRILSSKSWYKTVEGFDKFSRTITKRGSNMVKLFQSLARVTLGGGETLFDQLGYYYLGPIDGHNLSHVIPVLENIKRLNAGPILLHLVTHKGQGYGPAEDAVDKFHGVSTFNVQTGEQKKSSFISYSKIVGLYLVEKAKQDKYVVGITAAMPSGTGLDQLAEHFPDRFFDVGIAEQHAVDFAGGLATAGMKPFVAIYSTFLQRAYDQIIHDIALTSLPVRFLLDRAGLVGEDGVTHQGIYDLVYLSAIANVVIVSPRNAHELVRLLETAYLYTKGPIFIRYEKEQTDVCPNYTSLKPYPIGKGEKIQQGEKLAIIGLGSLIEKLNHTDFIRACTKQLGYVPTIFDARFLKPFDDVMVTEIMQQHAYVVSVEEGIYGGLSGQIFRILNQLTNKKKQPPKYYPITLPDAPIYHAKRMEQLESVGLTPDKILKTIVKFIQHVS